MNQRKLYEHYLQYLQQMRLGDLVKQDGDDSTSFVFDEKVRFKSALLDGADTLFYNVSWLGHDIGAFNLITNPVGKDGTWWTSHRQHPRVRFKNLRDAVLVLGNTSPTIPLAEWLNFEQTKILIGRALFELNDGHHCQFDSNGSFTYQGLEFLAAAPVARRAVYTVIWAGGGKGQLKQEVVDHHLVWRIYAYDYDCDYLCIGQYRFVDSAVRACVALNRWRGTVRPTSSRTNNGEEYSFLRYGNRYRLVLVGRETHLHIGDDNNPVYRMQGDLNEVEANIFLDGRERGYEEGLDAGKDSAREEIRLALGYPSARDMETLQQLVANNSRSIDGLLTETVSPPPHEEFTREHLKVDREKKPGGEDS